MHSLAAIPSCFGRGTHQHSLDLPSIGRGSRARSVLKVHKDALTSSPRLLLPNHHTLRQDPCLTLHICISGSMRIDMMANDMGFQECSGCSSISIWSCCPTWPYLLSVKSLPSGPSFGAQAFPSSHCRGPGLRENSWAACSSVHQCQSLQRCRGSLALGNTSASTE